MNTQVYITSEYTAFPEKMDAVTKQIMAADAILSLPEHKGAFLTFVCPLFSHLVHEYNPREYETWIKHDLEWLRRSDCLLVLPKQYESDGRDIEIREAERLNIPVFTDYKELYDFHVKRNTKTLFTKQELIDIVSEATGRPAELWMAKDRQRENIYPRAIFAMLYKYHSSHQVRTQSMVGMALSKNHATVSHYQRNLPDWIWQGLDEVIAPLKKAVAMIGRDRLNETFKRLYVDTIPEIKTKPKKQPIPMNQI